MISTLTILMRHFCIILGCESVTISLYAVFSHSTQYNSKACGGLIPAGKNYSSALGSVLILSSIKIAPKLGPTAPRYCKITKVTQKLGKPRHILENREIHVPKRILANKKPKIGTTYSN